MKEDFRELMLEMITSLYEIDGIEWIERQWDEQTSRSFLVLHKWEQPEDALFALLTKVRALDTEATRSLLWLFGDPACGYGRAGLLSVSKRGDDVVIRADCPWLDQYGESHDREGDIVLSDDDRLIFPSGGQIVLSEFFLQICDDTTDDQGMLLSYIGR